MAILINRRLRSIQHISNRFVNNKPTKVEDRSTVIKIAKIPDENPDLPKKHVFQKIIRKMYVNPISTMDQASDNVHSELKGLSYRYPRLATNYGRHDTYLIGTENQDTTIVEFPNEADYLIVGGGLIGSATAYYLKRYVHQTEDVLVIDKDPYSPHNNTVMSTGLLSAQSGSRDISRLTSLTKELIRNLKNDLLFEKDFLSHINYRPCTHLILWREQDVPKVLDSIDTQLEDGASVEAKLPGEIESIFPWLKVSESDVFIVTHGNQDEAVIDPIGLRNVYRTLAQAHGAHFLLAEAIDFNTVNSNIKFHNNDSGACSHMVLRNPTNGELININFFMTLMTLGYNTPFLESRIESPAYVKGHYGDLHFVQPRLKIQFCFQSLAAPTICFPAITDTDGSLLIQESYAGDFKYHLTYEESEKFQDFDVQYLDLESDDPYRVYYHKSRIFERYFEEEIKPRLVKRIPSMEDAKFLVAISGYECVNNFDGLPVLGPHPLYDHILVATGLGSRLASLGPAVALTFSEIMNRGLEQTFDITQFYWNRVIGNRKIDEFDIFKR